MSGEYYGTDDNTKFFTGYQNISNELVQNNETCLTNNQDFRLRDIEEQLEMAENRCNTLKDQLDYMKELYGVNKNTPKTRKISNILPYQKISSGEKLSSASFSNEIDDKETKMFPKPQNSNAISTDNTGAAVRTINNILNGITNSVNRLSELHVQISETPRSRKVRSTGVSPHQVIEANTKKSHSSTNEISVKSDLNKEFNFMRNLNSNDDTYKPKLKRKLKEAKLLNKRPLGSQQSVRRNKKIEKQNKFNPTKISVLDRNSATVVKRKYFNSVKQNATSHKLVEIYHNNAAKNSDSDEGHSNKVKTKHSNKQIQCKKILEHDSCGTSCLEKIQPLDILEMKEDSKMQRKNMVYDISSSNVEIMPNIETDFCLEPPQAPRTDISCYSKSYELPTIASKLKQVAKSYLNTFNFKAIPFCAAISTSPSHNIGINIQQVMNIIKTRQPINGISPTLAHNIGLAAERLNSRPLSALISTINSKTGYKPSKCPLSKTMLNYQQLQELAKAIPEETAEEVEGETDSPAIKTIIITGPSGDMEVKNRYTPSWGIDPLHSEECTCVSKSGQDFQEIVNKYQKLNTSVSAKIRPQSNNSQIKFSNTYKKKDHSGKFCRPTKNGYTMTNIISIDNKIEETSHLQGKERNLKEVLTNLHNEFEYLNKRYEELSQLPDADEDTIKELESMEVELNKKEEEITMVMTLYKEVLALKQQIKNLKQRASQSSMTTNEQRESSFKFKDYNNPQAAFHLTKLLRQIQHYQMRYKKDITGV